MRRLAHTRASLLRGNLVRPSLKRTRWRHLAGRVCGIVAVLAVSYLGVANVFLRTRLVRNAISGSTVSFAITGNSTDLRLDYESAYSIIPGRVHVEGLTFRGRERTVEWLVTLDHADVSISLVGLLRRSFHATRLRASGLSMRARLRLDPVDARPDVLAALPAIAGFSDPPLLDVGPAPPPLTDANYKLWMIELEDVDVEHVRQLWVHTVRSEGDTRVRGRWVFHPQRWVDVGPATVDTNGVDISYGSHSLATGLHGSIIATVHPFDLRQAEGLEFFDHVSSSGQLRGRASIADALGLLAPRSGIRFTRWEGPLDFRMVLDHGALADGTHVWIEATDCEAEADGLILEGPIRTELDVEGDVASMHTRVAGLRISRLGVERARVASIVAMASNRHLKIAQAFEDARFSLDVAGAETDDIGAWTQYLTSTPAFVVRSGTATADGHADGLVAERRGRAELRLWARHLRMEHGSDQFTTNVTSAVQLREVSLSGGWAVGAATISADDLTGRLGSALVAGKVAMQVELRRGTWADRRLDLSGSDVVLRAVSARSTRSGAAFVVVPVLTLAAPRLVLVPSGMDGHVSIDLPSAELQLGGLRELLPLPKGLVIEEGRGRARLHAEVELDSGRARGEGELVAHGIRARLGSTPIFGDLDCTVTARHAGTARGSTDLSGSTLAIMHAGTGNAASLEDAWWGNATLREATLRTNGAVRLDAKAHLTAKDATPATVLGSQNMGVPTFAANVFRMPVLEADAQVRVAPSSFEVHSLVARGGRTFLRAEYAKRDGRQDGAVLVDLGWIALGYDLADGATGMVLIGPESWFARKAATMGDEAASAKRKADAAEQLARYSAMTPRARMDEARTLAAQCGLDVRTCDGTAVESLLRTTVDARERDILSGITYAPTVVAAAKGGTDGTTLTPLVMDSLAEAFRIGGESTLDNIPSIVPAAAARDSDAARGKVVAVAGRASSMRRDGAYSVGILTTDSETVYFATPFATHAIPGSLARFRGVFVQRYAPAGESHGQPPSLVLVGAFGP